ncbi:type I-C CRISPR-associated protein Cas7/Csd2 [Thermaerobacter sp. FW80]|uniref:type I-C CRISPR-associated protein Cas7/Csd2 n=1 Tax=Thermaerobacter sp. FW80 TaxID=2546351 RepID=UPI0010753B7A|nr:type I-C CRISPR-associated protein Cas7/Csd2 [Thermaerobacter sp. FW80]QBS38235.1 type I-C CRISPR-associated protein Cas7/Csd2 [Thermaerobacter sp. FW80]
MVYTDPTKRHEFVLLFDAKNSNPNGDPDAGNMPRVDPETMHGLVTDVALKRKIRDYLQLTRLSNDREAQSGFDIFIQSRTPLNMLIQDAGKAVGVVESKTENEKVRKELCHRYYDIRMFGAVLSTGTLNAGQVRGPVQITFARSIDPVLPLDLAITRQAITSEQRREARETRSAKAGRALTTTTEMGRKPIIPYGLYRAHGYFNPYLATQTGVSQEDLEVLWEALQNLFEFDRSAARGEMHVRGLIVFTHDNPKGNAPAHKLFDLVTVRRRDGVSVPRGYHDYAVVIQRDDLPPGVTLSVLVEP